MTNETNSRVAQRRDFAALKSLTRTAEIMRKVFDKGGNRLMSIWDEDVQAVEEAVAALAPGNPGATNEIHSSDGGGEMQTRGVMGPRSAPDPDAPHSGAGVAPGPSEASPSPATQPQPDSKEGDDLARTLFGNDECAPDCMSFDEVSEGVRDYYRRFADGVSATLTARVDAPAAPPVDAVRAWRSIETAPKKGCVLIAGGTFESSMSMAGECTFVGPTIASYDEWDKLWKGDNAGGHDEFYWHKPTHWMPLPLPPDAGSRK